MLAKTILVIWLLAGRGDVRFQYILRFESEAACQIAAKQIETPNGNWNTYPVQHATCVVDGTPLLPPNQTKKR